MSIFSRLFNKNAESDGKEPEGEDGGSPSTEKREDQSMRTQSASKQSRPPSEGKGGTMRPVAPSLQINPPSTERRASASSATAKTAAQGGDDQELGAVAAPQSSPGAVAGNGLHPTAQARAGQVSDQGQGTARRGVNRATARLGSNASAPAYAAPSAQATTRSRQSSRPPRGDRALATQAAVAAQPVLAAQPRAGAGGKSTGEAVVSSPKASSSQRMPASPGIGDTPGGPLTLEFGASLGEQAAIHDPEVARVPHGFASPPLHAAPPFTETKGRSYIENLKLLNDLDEAFGAIVDSANVAVKRLQPSEQPPSTHSIAELKELFSALAANHMQQVRDFMIGLKWGEAPRDWVPICEPAIASLLRAAKEMDLDDLFRALEDYRGALQHAADATGTTIAGEMRERLIATYAKLTELMPEAFGLDGERGRREAIIVHALLQQVPEVRKVTIDKIYAAGLSNLDSLFLAKPDEIAATTGMSEGLASRIVEKVQRYRQEMASFADATRSAEREHLVKLAGELRQLHQQFEAVASAWSEDAHTRKKELRQARAVALLQVKVLLARLGEIDRLGQLERLPFERKIEELERYLEAGPERAPAS